MEGRGRRAEGRGQRAEGRIACASSGASTGAGTGTGADAMNIDIVACMQIGIVVCMHMCMRMRKCVCAHRGLAESIGVVRLHV